MGFFQSHPIITQIYLGSYITTAAEASMVASAKVPLSAI